VVALTEPASRIIRQRPARLSSAAFQRRRSRSAYPERAQAIKVPMRGAIPAIRLRRREEGCEGGSESRHQLSSRKVGSEHHDEGGSPDRVIGLLVVLSSVDLTVGCSGERRCKRSGRKHIRAQARAETRAEGRGGRREEAGGGKEASSGLAWWGTVRKTSEKTKGAVP
jgi:hypothetical protein